MARSQWSWLAAAAMAMTLHARVAAAGDNPLIAQGIQEYDDLMYEESVNTLSAALMRQGNTIEQQVEIYKYLGLNYMLLDKPDEAGGAFRKLLCIDEDWSFDTTTTSPKILTFFNSVKQTWIEEGKPGKAGPVEGPKVSIGHKVPDMGIKGEPIHLQITVEDPSLVVAGLFVFYKTTEGFLAVKATPSVLPTTSTVYMATLPGDIVAPPAVDYYMQAQDAKGQVLAVRGDADAPLRVTVPSKEGGSVAKKWWFWTIIGVAVAGTAGGVAGGVIAAKKKGGSSTDPAHVSIGICEHGLDCP